MQIIFILAMDPNKISKVGVHWFRHGLRLHDNPALLELLQTCDMFIPVFIFDGSTGFSGMAICIK